MTELYNSYKASEGTRYFIHETTPFFVVIFMSALCLCSFAHLFEQQNLLLSCHKEFHDLYWQSRLLDPWILCRLKGVVISSACGAKIFAIFVPRWLPSCVWLIPFLFASISPWMLVRLVTFWKFIRLYNINISYGFKVKMQSVFYALHRFLHVQTPVCFPQTSIKERPKLVKFLINQCFNSLKRSKQTLHIVLNQPTPYWICFFVLEESAFLISLSSSPSFNNMNAIFVHVTDHVKGCDQAVRQSWLQYFFSSLTKWAVDYCISKLGKVHISHFNCAECFGQKCTTNGTKLHGK